MEKIYLVRHCEANGQDPDAQMTTRGSEQAQSLARFFSRIEVDTIVSSPWRRAIDSITPTAEVRGMKVLTDGRLAERRLSRKPVQNWLEKLNQSFHDPDFSLPGGESGREARERGLAVIRDLQQKQERSTIVVTHGNLLVLLLQSFDSGYGFEDWAQLSNPDVFEIDLKKLTVRRVWHALGY